MIVTADELPGLRGSVTMVDGGFDPIHPGHVAYFAAAATLGAPVLCNVSGDDWVGRKHPPLLAQRDRATVIDAFRDIAYTFCSDGDTESVLRRLRPRFYAKGADWRDRLPEEQIRLCAEHDIEIVYLDTVLDSSSKLLREFVERQVRA